MALAVVISPNGIPVSSAPSPFGLPVVLATNGFGVPVTPVASGGRPVFDVGGNLFDSGSSVGPNYRMRAQAASFVFTGESMTIQAGYAMAAGVGAFALAGQSASLVPPVATYVGPGDVAGWGTAYGYWGLRAYNASKIGANCLDVCANQIGAAVNLTTVVIGSNGYVNLSGIGFSPIYVQRIYDQVGSQDLFLNSGGREILQTNMVGGKPAIAFLGDYYSSSANAVALPQPLSVGAVVRFNTYVAGGEVFTDGSFGFQPIVNTSANVVGQTFGISTAHYTNVADNNFAALVSVANGNTLSSMAVNGTVTPTADGVGPNGIGTTNKLTIGSVDFGAAAFVGYFYEVIVKAGAVSPANQAALSVNQHAIGTGWT